VRKSQESCFDDAKNAKRPSLLVSLCLCATVAPMKSKSIIDFVLAPAPTEDLPWRS